MREDIEKIINEELEKLAKKEEKTEPEEKKDE